MDQEQKIRRELEFEKCCEDYMPLVYSLIKKWRLFLEYDEYVQIGRIALYEAWMQYDPVQGHFAAYAKSYVYGRIKEGLYKQDRWGSRNVATEPVVLVENSPTVKPQNEELLFIHDWLEKSPLSEREMLWALEAICYGYKPGEIAERHGVSVHTVKEWRKKAIKKLRDNDLVYID